MHFFKTKNTNEVIEFYYNNNYFPNYEIALSSFSDFMVELLPDLNGFKENDVRSAIAKAIEDPMLATSRAKGKGLFSCSYDNQITISINKNNCFFKRGTVFPSHFLLRSTPFIPSSPEYNRAQHGKSYKATEYIVSQSLHFITYPDKTQEIIYFD